jgi:hypothetical protein
VESYLRSEGGKAQSVRGDIQGSLVRGRKAPGNGLSMTDDERDRLTRLEVQFTHLSKSMDDTHDKVTRMHDLLMQAKGMKYLIMLMATIGGAISALAVKYFPFLRG